MGKNEHRGTLGKLAESRSRLREGLTTGGATGLTGALTGALSMGFSPQMAKVIPSDKLRILAGLLGGGAIGGAAGFSAPYITDAILGKEAESATSASTSSSSGMTVEGPKTSTSFNTPTTGHMGVFKGTGFANTSRIKTSEEFEFPWQALTVPAGGAVGAGVGGLVAARGNPRGLLTMLKNYQRESIAKRLLGPLLVGSTLGAATGALGGRYLENRMPKEGAAEEPSKLKNIGVGAAIGGGAVGLPPYLGVSRQDHAFRMGVHNAAVKAHERTVDRLKAELAGDIPADYWSKDWRKEVLEETLPNAEERLKAIKASKPRFTRALRRNLKILLGLGGAGALVGGGLGYLNYRGLKDRTKEGALSKYALGIEQPNMITKSLRSAAGREGGYTAGNLSKGSGAYKPTRTTATLSEGKSSAMDKE